MNERKKNLGKISEKPSHKNKKTVIRSLTYNKKEPANLQKKLINQDN